MTQKEGYCLMLYSCEKCKALEILWNSRDKVTPFAISCRYCDGVMRHINWELDVYAPKFQPHKGMRIFVDLTEEKALQYVTRKVEKWWDDPIFAMKDVYKTKQDAINELTSGGVEDGEPDIEEVV